MASEVDRWRVSPEEGRQERKKLLVKQLESQTQGFELMEKTAIALGDVLSARLAELSPVEVRICSHFNDVPDIHLSSNSLGLLEASWTDHPLPF
jgi:hypothetical protein